MSYDFMMMKPIGEISSSEDLSEQTLALQDPQAVVDEFVDVHDYEQVFFTVCANVDPKRDVVLSEGPIDQLDHATLLRAIHSERQLYEVMCDFWSNHFSIWRSAKWMTHLKTRDDGDVIRPHALGRFADMLKASARSPAMLVYLDNYSSNAYSPSGVNENWGRELMQLFTIGLTRLNRDGSTVLDGLGQPVATYGQPEVLEMTRAFTGWTYPDTRAGSPNPASTNGVPP